MVCDDFSVRSTPFDAGQLGFRSHGFTQNCAFCLERLASLVLDLCNVAPQRGINFLLSSSSLLRFLTPCRGIRVSGAIRVCFAVKLLDSRNTPATTLYSMRAGVGCLCTYAMLVRKHFLPRRDAYNQYEDFRAQTIAVCDGFPGRQVTKQSPKASIDRQSCIETRKMSDLGRSKQRWCLQAWTAPGKQVHTGSIISGGLPRFRLSKKLTSQWASNTA